MLVTGRRLAELVVLGEGVRDLEPRSLGADVDCSVGPIDGASTSDDGDVDEAPSRTTEKSSEPQVPHGVSFASVADDQERSCAVGELQLSRSMPGNGLKAEPVAARQREQWQFAAYRNASATS